MNQSTSYRAKTNKILEKNITLEKKNPGLPNWRVLS